MAGNNTTEIILQLKLEMKDLQKQQKQFATELKKITKQVESLSSKVKGGSKDQTRAIDEVTKSAKKQSNEFAASEKKRRSEYKQTNNEVDRQKKKLHELGQVTQGRFGRFLTAFTAGAGVGGLRRSFSAAGFGSLLGRGISRGVGAIMGFGLSGIQQAYQNYVQYGMAQAGMVGLGSAAQLRTGRMLAGRARGARLGYSMIDTAQQAPGIARATGNLGAVYKAQQFARATGMDVGEVGGYMGMLRQAGYGFGGVTRPGGVDYNAKRMTADRSGTKVLEKVVAAGIYSGIERARLPEFLQGISGTTQAAGGRTTRRVDVEGIAAFAAMLGRSGLPGLQGARGMATMQQAMQATVTPGGGEAGQAMMLQALGFGKPGGQTTYYEALKQQQQGMQRPENVVAMFQEVYKQLGVAGGGGAGKVQQEANLALSEMTGLSLQQVEDLGEILNSGKSAEEQMAAIKEQLKSAEPIEKQALQQMKDFGGTASRIAGKIDTLIGYGAKAAPMIEKIEKWQLKALGWLVDAFPAISKWLEKIYNLILSIAEAFLPTKFQDILANISKSTEELKKKYGKGTLAEQADLAKQMSERQAAGKAAIVAETIQRMGRMGAKSPWSLPSWSDLKWALGTGVKAAGGVRTEQLVGRPELYNKLGAEEIANQILAAQKQAIGERVRAFAPGLSKIPVKELGKRYEKAIPGLTAGLEGKGELTTEMLNVLHKLDETLNRKKSRQVGVGKAQVNVMGQEEE